MNRTGGRSHGGSAVSSSGETITVGRSSDTTWHGRGGRGGGLLGCHLVLPVVGDGDRGRACVGDAGGESALATVSIAPEPMPVSSRTGELA